MKKAYSKPEIVFESFSLSTSIATCRMEASFDASLGKWGCKGYKIETDDGNLVIFMSDYNGCQWVEADGDFNGICYDVPSDPLNLFGS